VLIVTLELVPRTHMDRTALLIRPIRTVGTPVADQRRRNTPWSGSAATLELARKARVRGAVTLVGRVVALRRAVADLEWRDAVERRRGGHRTLEELRLPAHVRPAVRRFVGAVTAVVDAIATPPERDAAVRRRTGELGAGAVGEAGGLVGRRVVAFGTDAHAVAAARPDEAQGAVSTSTVVGTRIAVVSLRVERLPKWMEHLHKEMRHSNCKAKA